MAREIFTLKFSPYIFIFFASFFVFATIPALAFDTLHGTPWDRKLPPPQPVKTNIYKNLAATALGTENIGNPENRITYTFSIAGIDANGNSITATWTDQDKTDIANFLDKAIEELLAFMGPPANSTQVTLQYDLRYYGTNAYSPIDNTIYMSPNYNYRLLVHEFVHAWFDDYGLSANESWNYVNTTAPINEAFAEGIAREIMNIMAKKYPSLDLYEKWDSEMLWAYEEKNDTYLICQELWSAGNNDAPGIAWDRYMMGAAAIHKMVQENPDFIKNFVAEYFKRIREDSSFRPTRATLFDVIKTVLPTIEGVPAMEWLDRQQIFKCEISIGKKIYRFWDRNEENFIEDRVYYLDTDPSGNDNWDGYNYTTTTQGKNGTNVFYDWNSSNIATYPVNSSIEEYPNNFFHYIFHYISESRLSKPVPIQVPVYTFGLYKSVMTYESTSNTRYFVAGEVLARGDFTTLDHETNVYGGIIGGNGGVIYLNHSGFENEAPLSVINNSFIGNRLWGGHFKGTYSSNLEIPQKTWSTPGKVNIVYVDASGNVYKTQRNIGHGTMYYSNGLGSQGSSYFILNVAEMTPASASDIPSLPAIAEVSEFRANGGTSIRLSWSNPSDPSLSGIVLVRKAGLPPSSRTDGVVLGSGAKSNYFDTDADTSANTVYFYRIWTYDNLVNYSAGRITGVQTGSDSFPGYPVNVSWDLTAINESGEDTIPEGTSSLTCKWDSATDSLGRVIEYSVGVSSMSLGSEYINDIFYDNMANGNTFSFNGLSLHLGQTYYCTARTYISNVIQSEIVFSRGVTVIANTTTTITTTSTTTSTTTTSSTTSTTTTTEAPATTTTSTTTTTTTSTICWESPVISGLSMESGSYLDEVTISGTDFCNDGEVTFSKGGVEMTAQIVNWTDSEIGVIVPWGCRVGLNKVKVTPLSGIGSNNAIFKIVKAKPRIAGMSSQNGKIGSEITITGGNFGEDDGLGKVSFGGKETEIVQWTNESITAKIPSMKLNKNGKKTVIVKVKTIYGFSNGKMFQGMK